MLCSKNSTLKIQNQGPDMQSRSCLLGLDSRDGFETHLKRLLSVSFYKLYSFSLPRIQTRKPAIANGSHVRPPMQPMLA